MSGRRFSPKEMIAIKANFPKYGKPTLTAEKLAKKLSRTVASVQIKASRMGLHFNGPTEEELEAIRSFYKNQFNVGMGRLRDFSISINRSPSFVCGIAKQLGLTNKERPKHWLPIARPDLWRESLKHLDSYRLRARHLIRLRGQECECCRRSKAVDRHHVDGNPKNNAVSNIALLCRKCHMVIDGRIEKLKNKKPRILPAKKCKICLELSKPLRRGRCHRCNEYFRRHQSEWSAVNVAAKLKNGVCPCCSRLNGKTINTTCHTCREYARRNGACHRARHGTRNGRG